MISYTFFVPGIPRPQGSKTPTRGGGMRESSPGLPAWRQAVKLAARRAAGGELARIEPIRTAVLVDGTFIVPGLATDPPDTDKLQRAIGDALTDAGVLADDSLITDWKAKKRQGVNPGAHIYIEVL